MAADLTVAIIGFGEAGRSFARGWKRDTIAEIRAFDLKADQPIHATEMREAYENYGVTGAFNSCAALAGAGLVFCLVPADQALIAAQAAAPYLPSGAMWIDGTSSAPQTKRASASQVLAAGARYVDMAIMAPVETKGHRTATLLAGPDAESAAEYLHIIDMDTKVIGTQVGEASAIKMIRSVMIKGMEALTAECLLAARRAGVEAQVIGSLEASNPEISWRERSVYNLERMNRHGLRRAAEMREAVTTLSDLGLPNHMAAAMALWHDQIGGLGVEDAPTQLEAALDDILERIG